MSDLIQEAEDAISALYGDMDVDQSVTLERMEELQGFIQDLINGFSVGD